MDADEVKQFVSELLKKDGFSKCDFDLVMHAQETNVWNVVVTSGVKKFEIILTDEKKIISKNSINEFHRFIFEDKINISDKVELTSTREYIKKNPKKSTIEIFILCIAPFIGYFLGDGNPIPIALGFIIGGMSFVIGSSKTFHKEIEHFS